MSRKINEVAVAPLLFLLSLLLLLPTAALSQESETCLSCHSAMKGTIKTQGGSMVDLNVDADRFKSSVHAALPCTECHLKFSGGAHASTGTAVPSDILSLSSKISAKFTSDPVAGAACIKCHEEVYQKVLSSVHGKNIIEKRQRDGALCLDCHGSPHYITKIKDGKSPVSRKYQVETCGKCHGSHEIIEKYKLEENVMDSFNESFHGRKLRLGHIGAPSCASCHGSHGILSAKDPKSPVNIANKKATCGKCHSGATDKFVAAITHKPFHPIAHFTEIGLIILTVGTFMFIIIHVLLDIISPKKTTSPRTKACPLRPRVSLHIARGGFYVPHHPGTSGRIKAS